MFSFAAAGASGFVIDITVLYVLMLYTPLGPFVARIISILCAMTSNFLLNRTFTFGQSDRGFWQELVRYASIGSIGVFLNYAIYAAFLLFIPGFSPFLATFIAVIIVAFFSYFGYSKFVFTK
ncbi:MAG: GtrA family protein [Ahrensia sp.]|nr:GtrA family protein [Ahrensia sp.]